MKIAELELKILSVLWELGKPSSVQGIIDSWTEDEQPGYTTVLKKLQIMEQKKIVSHKKNGKAYDYFPLIDREKVTQNRLDEILNRVYRGNRLEMAAVFFQNTPFSSSELDEVKSMIEALEDDNSDNS